MTYVVSEKIQIGTTALLKPFKFHDAIKENLMHLINNAYNDTVSLKSEYYGDKIHRLDWSKNLDYESRDWIKFIKPKLEEHFKECSNELNYQNCTVKGMWFQQYVKNNKHGWHIHGENYTGVYYLEMPKEAPKTELIDQYNINKKITIDAKEGDIVIFPSFIIHRAPKVQSDTRKTIVSFNLEFNLIDKNIFKVIE